MLKNKKQKKELRFSGTCSTACPAAYKTALGVHTVCTDSMGRYLFIHLFSVKKKGKEMQVQMFLSSIAGFRVEKFTQMILVR